MQERVGFATVTSGNCSNTGGQLAQVKRFHQVVVSTGVKSLNTIGYLVEGGQDDDRRLIPRWRRCPESRVLCRQVASGQVGMRL